MVWGPVQKTNLKFQSAPKWQNGGGQKWQSAPKDSRADGMAVDKDARYEGTVLEYHKWSGYGFIKPEEDGVVPKNKVYVHWSNIQSEDRFPFLMKDTRVEFGLMKWKNQDGTSSLRAKTVTKPGGEMIALQDDHDAEKKTFVGGQHLRYTGTLKWYNPKMSCGYVLLDDGFALDEPVPKELKVFEQEVNGGGKKVQKYMEDLHVEFGIHKDPKGKFLVYNMTLPGGVPVTQENLENRKNHLGDFKGKIHSWAWKDGWGLIEPDSVASLPSSVQAKMNASPKTYKSDGQKLYFRKTDLARGSTTWLKKGQECTFQTYTDDKGVGACEVRVEADGKP